MIRSIYLVARRDYLGYVQAWGFWLGLMLTPILLAVGIMAPTWAENSQPTRYYTVIESGSDFTEALRAEIDETRVDAARLALDPASVIGGSDPNEALQTFDNALAGGASVEAALDQAGAPAIELPQAGLIHVDPPAITKEGLTPYLLGQKLVDTPEGPQPLFAAILVPDGDGDIQYWSENVTADSLLRQVQAAEQLLAERRVFEAAGVSPDLLRQAAEDAGIRIDLAEEALPGNGRRIQEAGQQIADEDIEHRFHQRRDAAKHQHGKKRQARLRDEEPQIAEGPAWRALQGKRRKRIDPALEPGKDAIEHRLKTFRLGLEDPRRIRGDGRADRTTARRARRQG